MLRWASCSEKGQSEPIGGRFINGQAGLWYPGKGGAGGWAAARLDSCMAEDKSMGLPERNETGLSADNWAESGAFWLTAGAAEVNDCLVADPKAKARGQWSKLPLHWAALYGRLEAVMALLDGGADIHTCDCYGDSVAHHAAVNRDAGVMRYLIAHGVDFKAANGVGQTPLHMAAADGCAETVAVLIEAGADIHACEHQGYTPLHRAGWEHPETIAVLVKAGANLEAADEGGDTPLGIAARWGTPAMVEALLAAGANPNMRDKGWYTPLHKAVTASVIRDGGGAYRRGDAKKVEMLIAAGAGIEAETLLFSRTALHIAGWLNHTMACCDVLIAAGANINARDDWGNTPLHLAAEQGAGRVVVGLVRAGAKIDDINHEGKTALHVAACCDDSEAVEALLTEGADITIQDNVAWTALHYAVTNGCAAAVKVLITAGAATVRGDAGKSIFMAALARGSAEIVQILSDAGIGRAILEADKVQ